MARTVRYLTHPQVLIEPTKDVRQWSLNSIGRARVSALAARPEVLQQTGKVISSDEVKALETALPLAAALGLELEVDPQMHENDRTATGFLPPKEFERVADQFFANPFKDVRGWERAIDAQCRIVAAVEACLAVSQEGDVLFVGHGGVGTLLYCALSNVGISRRFDQGPGGGFWFSFEAEERRPLQEWQPMETLRVGRQPSEYSAEGFVR
ncbi:histidine phosphatase family protein (plasmid) [Paracoccus liaowanqingii]|uniref:Histidine phosphatase family protein n=1 Tax=Paracoccus liaowanqingii TaxID=2560053 RepID=A0A4Y5SU83_9RHOB|nr:histidine phosphatase family protein [Paracoccus liaowanqingii]QDA36306.1 histidine phosphatase family protein [Paracoccus liaowanqingii]